MKENNNTFLEEIIGQDSIKSRLKIYSDSYSKTGELPFAIFCGTRGGGKTKLAREFRKTLVHPEFGRPKILEVNAATVRNVESFFDHIYPMWVDNNACLFVDEFHELPDKLATLFLTVLEKDKNPIRKITVDHKDGSQEYVFDFTKISFMCATTDQQKVLDPLNDRLETIALRPYTGEHLFEIFETNCEVEVCQDIKREIIFIFRGHPRDCVAVADKLGQYANAKTLDYITIKDWRDFCYTMGIYPYGLNDSEVQIVKLLGERGESSLEAMSASTGFSKEVIRKKYEHALLKKGLMDIKGKRSLTREVVKFFKTL